MPARGRRGWWRSKGWAASKSLPQFVAAPACSEPFSRTHKKEVFDALFEFTGNPNVGDIRIHQLELGALEHDVIILLHHERGEVANNCCEHRHRREDHKDKKAKLNKVGGHLPICCCHHLKDEVVRHKV